MTTSPTPTRELRIDKLPVSVYASADEMGLAAALDAREGINAAIDARGEANVILATGNSQLNFLRALRDLPGIDWTKVRVFHLDEYVGISPDHHASFPKFLREHFIGHVPVGNFHPIAGTAENAEATSRDYEALLREYPADLVALGWGENGHLAFNDPPYALFDDPNWVKVIELAQASRKQQVGEGHFPTIDDVPTHAITVTIPALLAAKQVLCIVPEARKVTAVNDCLYKPVAEDRPGSILRTVDHAKLYLDPESAGGLE